MEDTKYILLNIDTGQTLNFTCGITDELKQNIANSRQLVLFERIPLTEIRKGMEYKNGKYQTL
jgi:hypothetical protein